MSEYKLTPEEQRTLDAMITAQTEATEKLNKKLASMTDAEKERLAEEQMNMSEKMASSPIVPDKGE